MTHWSDYFARVPFNIRKFCLSRGPQGHMYIPRGKGRLFVLFYHFHSINHEMRIIDWLEIMIFFKRVCLVLVLSIIF